MRFQRPLKRPVEQVLKLLHVLRLLRVETNDEGRVVESSNFTLLNLWLVWFGPMREDKLAMGVLAFQTSCGLIGLFVRHRLALWVFAQDNL